MKPPSDSLYEAVLATAIAVCTIAVAWSSYQAQRWDGLQTYHYANASALRSAAARHLVTAGQEAQIDIDLFTQYVAARIRGEVSIASHLLRRFRPESRRALDAWLATKPFANADAPPSPFRGAEYRLRSVQAADLTNAQADSKIAEALSCNATSDKYAYLTVLFAVALSLAAIAMRLKVQGVRTSALVLICLVVTPAIGVLLFLPVH